jgi:hypothetical protein
MAQLAHLRGKVQAVAHGLDSGTLTPELAVRVLQRSIDEVEVMGAKERDLASETDWRG